MSGNIFWLLSVFYCVVSQKGDKKSRKNYLSCVVGLKGSQKYGGISVAVHQAVVAFFATTESRSNSLVLKLLFKGAVGRLLARPRF
ncbi:MAG: hypothetical protein SWH68_07800 [Thermodesulfobacteriota bacterium]|nr:hypothetical protein [Thermodesulfobacteriota bacterium]